MQTQTRAAAAPTIMPGPTRLFRRNGNSGSAEGFETRKLGLTPRSMQNSRREPVRTGIPAENYGTPDSPQRLTKGTRRRDLTLRLPRISPIQRSGKPMIQRSIRFEQGSVEATGNAAEDLVKNVEAGIAWPKLNGHRVLTADQIRAALNLPGIATTTPSLPQGPIQCWVNYVRDNVGSFEIHTLSNGPWSAVVPKVFMAGRFGLEECRNSPAGTARFTAHGIPSDAALAAHTLRHEQHHAADHEQVFRRVVGAWDSVLTQNERASPRRTATDADRTTCEAHLYPTIGASLDVVSERFAAGIDAAGNAFHASAGGNALAFHSVQSDAACNNVTAQVEPDRFRNIPWARSLRELSMPRRELR